MTIKVECNPLTGTGSFGCDLPKPTIKQCSLDKSIKSIAFIEKQSSGEDIKSGREKRRERRKLNRDKK